MTALPSKTPLIATGYSKQEFRDALGGIVDFLSGVMGTAGTVSASQVAMQILLGAGCTTKSTTYTLAIADRGKVFRCDGTWTFTVLAAATAGNGFAIALKNIGSGTITISGVADASALIPGSSIILVCNGTTWESVGGNAGVLAISQGGTGATTASGARNSLGVKQVAAGYGGVGTPYLKFVASSSSGYTPGSLYSLSVNSIAGSWRCVSNFVVGTSGSLTLFERES